MWTCPHCRLAFADGRFCPRDGAALVLEIDGHVVVRELGRGLTGTVHAARAPDGTHVAIKILHRDWLGDGEMYERFVREARAAAAIAHPCVVAPRGSGVLEDGRPYLVMPLVEGPSLDDVLALGPLAEPRALAIARDLAGALAAVHAAGVLHRDVKPSNVRIGRDGRARLLDFGIAVRTGGDEARLTGGGMAVGTPQYMAPEQCSGDALDGRTDVYALGVVLYRLLTGRLPFDGSAVAVMLAHTGRMPEPPSTHAAITPTLDALVMRCLAKRRAARPTAAELAEELAALAWGLDVDPRAATEADDRVGDGHGDGNGDGVGDGNGHGDGDGDGVGDGDVLRHGPRSRSGLLRMSGEDGDGDVGRSPRPRRRLHAFVGLALAVAAAVTALAPVRRAIGLDDAAAAAPAVARPRPLPAPVAPPPADVALDDHQLVVATDDLVAIRVAAPAVLAPRADHVLTVEVWDADGRPLDTTDLVVTFAGPRGAVVGLAAEPTRTRGVYRVTARFGEPGPWVMRVFAPIGDSVVQFVLDVGVAATS